MLLVRDSGGGDQCNWPFGPSWAGGGGGHWSLRTNVISHFVFREGGGGGGGEGTNVVSHPAETGGGRMLLAMRLGGTRGTNVIGHLVSRAPFGPSGAGGGGGDHGTSH